MPGSGSVRRLGQIDHQQRADPTSKALDLKIQISSPDLSDRANPTDEITSLIPTFETTGATCPFPDDKSVMADWQRIFARFH